MVRARTIAIIGAGPSGLMAAERMAQAGHQVTLYDRMPSPARKFLLAGRGGLNLTHNEPLPQFLARYGEAEKWLEPTIRAFPPEQLRAWCESLGETTFVGSSGRVFPSSMKATKLLRSWLHRLEQLHVVYRPRHEWQGWEGDALRFRDPHGTAFWLKPDVTLLALGGASWPRLGADGEWVRALVSQGIEVAPLKPANCGFTVEWSEHFRSRFAGMPLKAIAATSDGVSRLGEAMITAKGIEGGVVYALSAGIREQLLRGEASVILFDLRPSMPADALAHKLSAPRASKSLSTFLQKAGFAPLAVALLRETTPAEILQHASPEWLAQRLKALPIEVTGTTGMSRAISTAGGVTRTSLDAHFMLKAGPGVFVAGEMLDWEAPTGGYLLQACFSTAVAAAEGMRAYCETLTD